MSKATYRDMTGPNGLLANHRPFEGNSMSARWLAPGEWPGRGRLDVVEAGRLELDYQTANDMNAGMYVVYSYSTPIAWAIQNVNGFDHLPAYCVAQRFSVTTSKGQGYVRAWINAHAGRFDVSVPRDAASQTPGWDAYRAERERIFGVKVGG